MIWGVKAFKQSEASAESMEAQLMLILSGKYIGYLPEHYAPVGTSAKAARPAADRIWLPGSLLTDFFVADAAKRP